MSQENNYIRAAQSEIKPVLNSPQELLEKAVSYMAARWVTVGSPDREKLSIEYCNLKPEKQKQEIRVRRVKQTEFSDYLEKLARKRKTSDYESLREQINSGHVLDEFLLPEEYISHNIIKTRKKIVA